MTDDQLEIYNAYFREIHKMQRQAANLLEDNLRWRYPDEFKGDGTLALWRQKDFEEIYDCIDMMFLASIISELDEENNEFMMEKLSENIEVIED